MAVTLTHKLIQGILHIGGKRLPCAHGTQFSFPEIWSEKSPDLRKKAASLLDIQPQDVKLFVGTRGLVKFGASAKHSIRLTQGMRDRLLAAYKESLDYATD